MNINKNLIPLISRAARLVVIVVISGFALSVLPSCKKEDPAVKYARLMETARKYIAEDKLEEAKITLYSAVDLRPDQASTYFELGEVLTRLKQYSKAAESFLAAINADPNHKEARLHLATLYLLSKEWEQADSHTRKLLEADPKNTAALILKASIARGQGRLDEAFSILDDVLKTEPNNIAALSSMGDLAIVRGDTAKGEELFLKVLKLDAKNAPVRLALADLYTRQNRLDDAQGLLENLIKGDPANSGLHFYYGEFLLGRGMGDEATAEFLETLQTDPLRHDARDIVYDMYLTRGKPDAAKKLTADLIASHPDDPAVYYFKGRDAELAQDPKTALDNYLKAVVSMRSFAPAFRRAGLIEIASGKRREGIEHLNQAVGIDPFDVGARIALAQDAFAHKDYAAAQDHVNRVLARYPRQLGANMLRADIALLQGDAKTATAIYQVLIQAFPESPMGYFKLGLLAENQKDIDGAIAWYKKGIALDRKVALGASRLAAMTAHKYGAAKAIEELTAQIDASKNSKAELKTVLATTILSNGKPSADDITRARELLSQAIEERPNLLSAYYALAAVYRVQSNLTESAAQFEKIVKLQPQQVPPRMLLGITYESMGNTQGAMEQYSQILKLAPRFAPAANNLAWILAESGGDLNEALRLAKIAKEELPRESSVTDTLGWVYFKQGSVQAALPVIAEAVALETAASPEKPNPEILFHLGVVKQHLGDSDGASAAFEQALAASGNSDTLKSRIEAVKHEATRERSNVTPANS